ncbi:MAG: M1 family metallopeptidase, partial [Bacteroidota bacterium]
MTEYHVPERPLPREIVPPQGYRLSVMRGNRTTNGQPGENYWQQFTEYDIEVILDPAERMLSANAQITWHNNSPDTLRRIHLELVQNHHAEGAMRNRPAEVTGGINLERVAVDGEEFGQERESRNYYNVNGTRMSLWLPAPVGPGEQAQIDITYDFLIPQRGASGRMGHSRDNLFYLGYWYPHMVVYDDVVGWHPDPYLGQAEFYHGFGDYELTIHAPADWIVMATGQLQNPDEVLHPEVLARWQAAMESDEPARVFTAGEDAPATVRHRPAAQDASSGETDTLLAWRFSARNVRDVAFSATRASHWDAARTPVGDLSGDGQDDYTVINTFWREEAPLWSEVTAYQQHAITFLSEMTGFPYPWPHMTAVEGAGIIGGGMEYPMMTLMGDYNQRGAEALYSVTAHELAHMWVPMTVSTDERRYSWVDEGNTVFSTAEAVQA